MAIKLRSFINLKRVLLIKEIHTLSLMLLYQEFHYTAEKENTTKICNRCSQSYIFQASIDTDKFRTCRIKIVKSYPSISPTRIHFNIVRLICFKISNTIHFFFFCATKASNLTLIKILILLFCR